MTSTGHLKVSVSVSNRTELYPGRVIAMSHDFLEAEGAYKRITLAENNSWLVGSSTVLILDPLPLVTLPPGRLGADDLRRMEGPIECPDCGSIMRSEGGCWSCPICGYGECESARKEASNSNGNGKVTGPFEKGQRPLTLAGLEPMGLFLSQL